MRDRKNMIKYLITIIARIGLMKKSALDILGKKLCDPNNKIRLSAIRGLSKIDDIKASE